MKRTLLLCEINCENADPSRPDFHSCTATYTIPEQYQQYVFANTLRQKLDKSPDLYYLYVRVGTANLCVITDMIYDKDKEGRPTCKVYWDETLTDTTPYYLSLPETQLRANDGTPLRNYPSVWTFTKFPEGWKVTNRSFDKDRAEEFKYGVNRVRRPAKPPYEHNSFRQRAGINPVW